MPRGHHVNSGAVPAAGQTGGNSNVASDLVASDSNGAVLEGDRRRCIAGGPRRSSSRAVAGGAKGPHIRARELRELSFGRQGDRQYLGDRSSVSDLVPALSGRESGGGFRGGYPD